MRFLFFGGARVLNQVGSVGNDTIIGNNVRNSIEGLAGSDYLIGLGGSDIIDGGLGNDTLQGGRGNDIYIVDSKSDSVIELAESISNIDSLRLTTNANPVTIIRTAIDQFIVRVQVAGTHDGEFAQFSLSLLTNREWSVSRISTFDATSQASETLSGTDSVLEYAYQVGNTATGPFNFHGFQHGSELAVGHNFILDGQSFADIPVGTVLNGQRFEITQSIVVFDHDSPERQIGTVRLSHTFDAAGLAVDHTHNYSEITFISDSYSALLPFTFADLVTIGGQSFSVTGDESMDHLNAIADYAVASSSTSDYSLSLFLPSGGPDINGDWSRSTGPTQFWFFDNALNSKLYVNYVSGSPVQATNSRHIAQYNVTTAAPTAGAPIVRTESEGFDTIVASVNFNLPSNVESLQLSGGALIGTGNGLGNLITGTSGANSLFGLGGDDILYGGDGDDVLDGGIGNDLIYGDVGFDRVDYSLSTARIALNLSTGLVSSAGSGDDKIFDIEEVVGSSFNDVIIGDAFGNVLRGGRGSDAILGAGGNDVIIGGDVEGNELYGGLGNDLYILTAYDSIIENEGEGTDSVFTILPTGTLTANVEILKFTGQGDFIGTGNAEANTIIGGTGADHLFGLAGVDYLIGGPGDDVLDGGNGNDTLQGGTGNDIYFVDSRNDSTLEFSGDGSDIVKTTLLVYGLQSEIEGLVFEGTSVARTGVGNALDNQLVGTAGVDDLFGRSGSDRIDGGHGLANSLFGGIGNDIYVVRAVGDSIFEYAGEGYDSVETALASFVLPNHVEALIYTGTGHFTGIGSLGDNRLVGGIGNDFFDAKDGNDLIVGGAGDDVLFGGSGADQFRYETPLSGLDRIFDFTSGSDKIALLGTAFAHSVVLDFVANGAPVATSANSTFLYNSQNGILSFDADGTGAGAAVVLAQLNAGLTLAAGDFIFY